MATDVDLIIRIEKHENVTDDRMRALFEFLVDEGFLVLDRDLSVSTNQGSGGKPVVDRDAMIDALNGSGNYAYCSLKFNTVYGANKNHPNKLSALTDEIIEASIEAAMDNNEYTGASIYGGRFLNGTFDMGDGIDKPQSGFFFGGDGWLVPGLIAKKLQKKPLYSALAAKMKEIFKSKIGFDVEILG